MEIRERIAAGFEGWGRLLIRFRWLAIGATLALTAALGAQLPRIGLDNSVEAFLHEDDPTLADYNAFRDQFGRDDVSIIAIEPREVFDLAFLEELRALHRELEREVPHLDEVTSLINARSTRARGDELVVEDLMEQWPRDAGELAALERRVFANPLYLDTLISRDGRLTTVTVKPTTYSSLGADREALTGFDDEEAAGGEPAYLTEDESAALVGAVREVLARHQGRGFETYLAGAAVVEERLVEKMQSDMGRLLTASMLMVITVLYLMFRRASGVLLPLLTVGLSLVSAMGAMPLLGIPLSLTTEILPSFLLTVGVCYSVHVLVLFFQALDRGESREGAIVYALGHSGLAVVMTSLTTAGGLLSFVWAEVRPVSELGVVGPLGVTLSMLFSLLLLPALLAVTPLRARARGYGSGSRPANAWLRRAVVGLGQISARRPWAVVALSALVLLLASAGASRLRFSNNYFEWFPKGDSLRTAMELIDRELGGAVMLEAVVETGEENGLHAPELMRRLEALAESNRSLRHGELFIGKTVSLVDVLKETHRALNQGRAEFYAVPEQRQLVAQELLLFENSGSDDLEELVDSGFSRARVSMKIPWADWMLYPAFIARMQRHLEGALGDGVRIRLTGFSALMARAAASFITTMARSYTIALLVITPLMIFLLGSLGRGLLSMVPNLAPILFTLGFMGWLGIPLDMSTLLIGGIIIGLAVDDTIHFMYRFERSCRETGDPQRAVRETLETTGTAMLFTSVVLTAGFLVFTSAYMVNLATFGLLCGLATVVAFLADVTLGPALMVLVAQRQPALARAGRQR